MATGMNSTSEKMNEATSNLKMPRIDMNAIIDSYKKNLEILGMINKMSMEVYNGVVKLQSAFFKQSMEDITNLMDKCNKPAEFVGKLNDLTRDNVVKAIGNGKQISDMITSASNDISAATSKRIKESIEEAKHIIATK